MSPFPRGTFVAKRSQEVAVSLGVNIKVRFVGSRRLKFGAWLAIQGMRLMTQARGEYRIGSEHWRPSGHVKPHMTIDFAEPDVTKRQQESYDRSIAPNRWTTAGEQVPATLPCGCHPSGHQPFCDRKDLAASDYGG